MPSITLNKDRVLKLLGKKVDDSTLREKISYLGTDLEEITEGEIVVEIFPNRPDLLSEEGFARALKTFLGFDSGLKNFKVNKGDYEVIIDKSVSNVRPFTACLVAKNIKITDAVLDNLINIQEKLHVTYGRNRKKCAIGIYPLDNISFPVHFKALNPEDIKFVPLGETLEMNGFDLLEKTKAGSEYKHLLDGKSKFPVFIDSNNSIMSVPPILNSNHTGNVDNNTENLFVECSGFDFDVLTKSLNMIGTALSDMGCDIYSVNLKYSDKKRITPSFNPTTMSVKCDYVNKYLGSDLSGKEIVKLVEKMGFGAKIKSDNELDILIPCFRADVLHPIDIVEDVCIGFGFYNIEEEHDRSSSVAKECFDEKIKEKIRDLLIGDGLIENYNYSLVKFEDQKNIGLNNIIKIKNPNSSEFDSLRRNIFPVILKSFKNNKMNEYPQKIFEIGRIFKKEKDVCVENDALCVAMCSDNSNFTWAKQRLELLKDLLNLDFDYVQKDFDFFIKGRSAEIKIKINNKNVIVGFIGEVNLDVLRNYDLEHAVSLFELDLDVISKLIESKSKN